MDKLPLPLLSEIFDDVKNSYKFLFFLSLLELLNESNYRKHELNSKELAGKILALAWYPCQYYKLSLGKQDKLKDYLVELEINPGNKIKTTAELAREIEALITYELQQKLFKYVTFRLIRPFAKNGSLKSIADYKVNRKIITSVDQLDNPIYSIIEKSDKNRNELLSVCVSPEWIKYFQQNYTFLKAWTLFKFGHYIQKNNPNSFAVIEKISPTFKRVSLSQQRKFWKVVLTKELIRCPYSQEILSPEHFDLDHFLPRRYIAHDQFWNLIPTNPSHNREKNDRIPDWEFIEPYIELQTLVIQKYKPLIPNTKNEISNYLIALGIDTEEHLNERLFFQTKLRAVVQTHFEIAKNSGFSDVWKPKNS